MESGIWFRSGSSNKIKFNINFDSSSENIRPGFDPVLGNLDQNS
jgi:hypothetical protein